MKNSHYYLNDKKTTLFALTATLVMTELNTSTLVGFSSLGYVYHYSAISVSLVFLFGLLFYALTVAKKWRNVDAISVSEFFSQRYHKYLGILVACILWVAMLGFSANFIKSADILLHSLLPNTNSSLTSGVLCLVMLLLTIRKGLGSIIQIDKVSFILCFVVFTYLLWYGLSHPIIDNSMTTKPISSSFVLSLIIITIFTYILSPWYGQKIFSAISAKVAFKAVILASIIITAFYGITIYITAHFTPVLSTQNGDDAFAILLHTQLPLIVQPMIYMVLFLIAITTISALWNTMASIIYAHNTRIKNQPMLVAIIALVSYFIANIWIDHILDKMLLFNIPIAALAFSLLYGFYGKRHNFLGAIVSILVGTISAIIFYFYSSDFVFYWAFICIPLSFVCGLLPLLFKLHISDKDRKILTKEMQTLYGGEDEIRTHDRD